MYIAFVAKCEKQGVIKLLACNNYFYCETHLDSIDSLLQELQLLKFNHLKTGCVHAKMFERTT